MSTAKIKIPAELFALAESSHFSGSLPVEMLTLGPDDYHFDEPVTWEVDVTNTGAAFLVAGTAQGRAVCACARCLEDVHFNLDGSIEGYFLISGEDMERFDDEEEEPGADEFDVLPDDHIVDLEPLIRAALIVEMPGQPLCKDDCAGLCTRCGANLNEGPCNCESSDDDQGPSSANPFAVLADFKFE